MSITLKFRCIGRSLLNMYCGSFGSFLTTSIFSSRITYHYNTISMIDEYFLIILCQLKVRKKCLNDAVKLTRWGVWWWCGGGLISDKKIKPTEGWLLGVARCDDHLCDGLDWADGAPGSRFIE